ncbi:hypothetical protein JZ785_01845 [Alicyclobacillus curvatus]|nr:hypothetical protein JZ785_01845 [Alicyclobacillus curvatus]
MRYSQNQTQQIMVGTIVTIACVLPVAFLDAVPAYASTAPDFNPLSIVSGAEIGTVRLVGTPVHPGDSFAVAVNSTSQSPPAYGSLVPANASPYTLGMDISGLDKQTNHYLDVYEESNNQITAFHEYDVAPTSGLNLEHVPVSPIDVTPYLQYNTTTNQWQVVFGYTNPGPATTIPYGAENINIQAPNFRSNQPTSFPNGSASWGVNIDPTGANGAQTEDEWVLGTGRFGINSLNVAFNLTLSAASAAAPGQTIQISGTATNDAGGGVGYVPISLTASSGTVQQNSVVTAPNGNFSFDWTASMTPGPVTFSAEAIQPYLHGMTVTKQSQTTVSTASSWTHIVFNSPQSNLTPSQTTTVVGTVYDSQNQPLNNAVVNLYASSGTFSDNASSMTLQTNASGQFSTTYSAPASTGSVSLTAQLSNTNVVATTSFLVNSTGGSTGGPPVITTTTLPSGTVGQYYSQSLQADGLAPGDVWKLASTSPPLPQGLALSADGVISGLPSAAGNSSFAVTVTSSVYGASSPQQMAVAIQPAPANGGGQPSVVQPINVTYASKTLASQTVSAAGGDLNYHAGNVMYQLVAPVGSVAPGSLIKLVTPSSDVVQGVQSRLTDGTAALLYFGIRFAPQPPSTSSTLTINDANIPAGAKVFAVGTHGALIPVNAKVTQGQIDMLAPETSNYVVTAPTTRLNPVILTPDQRVIAWSGQTTIVPVMVKNNTTYMPIYYLMNLLNSLGVKSTWNGQQWNLTTSTQVDVSNIHAGTGDTSIYVNNTLVQKANALIASDPSSGKPTTYLPIWYLMQLMKRMGLQSTWNGTTWNVTK